MDERNRDRGRQPFRMHCAPCLNGYSLARPPFMYDNLCKFLIEEFTADFATWLLGEPIHLTELSPSELSLEPIRADSLILRESENLVLHVEFQTAPDPNMPFRMADYYLRVYRRFPQKEMRQIVVYLRETASEWVYQNTLELSQLRHRYEVIRLWEQPAEQFLEAPGLFPLASLSRTNNPLTTLGTVSEKIAEIANRRMKANIAASTALLAGLRLNKEEIQRLLRSEMIQESVIYQEIWETALDRGLQEGRQRGLQEGRQEAMREIAVQLLASGMAVVQVASITGLSVEQIEEVSDR